MKSWFQTKACASRVFCISCRTSQSFRASIYANGSVSEVNFACPYGVTEESASNPTGLGSFVERMVKPIAKLLGAKCYGEDGKLEPQSACAKRREKLNALSERLKGVTT